MIWHPNIVQIVAIYFLKNSILLVKEFIDGRNLEDLLFGNDKDSETFSIQACNKMSIRKKICQAVAYLYHLKPPDSRKDIKLQMWWLQNFAIWG